MSSTEDTLFEEEEALFHQEQGLAEMEAELHAQEKGLVQMEQRISKRNQTLTNLMSYISEQGESLTRRAEAIGPRALKLVEEALGGEAAADELESVVGKLEERQVMVERRREFLAMRQDLVEERGTLLVERQEAIETAEGRFEEAEEKLLTREQLITKTLRQLLTAASELQGDDDEDPSSLPPSRRRPTRSESTRSAGGKPMTIHAGEAEGADEGASRHGGHSRREDEATRRRRAGARVTTPTGGFRITLEILLGSGESSRLFRYEEDAPEDLPGVFLVTPSLLKEGREVRMRIHMGERLVTAEGVVSWRRTQADANGPPGMGIEIADLKPEDEETVRAWMREFPPLVV